MGAGVVAAQVVRIVGGHQRQAGLLREAIELRGEALVLLQVVVLHFEEEVVAAEDVGVGVGQAAGVVVLVGENGFGDVAAQAGGHADQPFGVLRQQVLIDARLVVEAVEVAGGNQLDEVAIAFLVLAEQHQVVVAVGIGARLVALLRNVHLAADHRMDAVGLGGVIELAPRRRGCRDRSWPRPASSVRPTIFINWSISQAPSSRE